MTTITAPAAPLLPPALAWHTASHERPCPTCARKIGKWDRVAHVAGTGPDNTPQHRHVCGHCTSSPTPRRTR